jgi:hypothetical protein
LSYWNDALYFKSLDYVSVLVPFNLLLHVDGDLSINWECRCGELFIVIFWILFWKTNVNCSSLTSGQSSLTALARSLTLLRSIVWWTNSSISTEFFPTHKIRGRSQILAVWVISANNPRFDSESIAIVGFIFI